MIIFLYGSDTYRSQQKLNEIIEHYKKIHKSGLNLSFFEAAPEGSRPFSEKGGVYGARNLNFQDFKSEVETISMFREKKLIVLKDVFSDKDFQEEFLKQEDKFVNSDNIILIYEKKDCDLSIRPKKETSPFLEFLKKNSKFQKFELLEGQKLKNWVEKEFEKYQTQIDSEALDELIIFVGSELWQMENEIKKLVSYKNGSASAEASAFGRQSGLRPTKSAGREKIKRADIELLVKPKIETDIFKTIDAISEKKKSQALTLLHQHLEKGDAPLYLLAMINFQFRNLLTIKDLIEKNTPYYKIINQSNLNPFVVKKSYQQSQKFTFQQLKKIYQKIFQADLNIKTGRIEPETALDLLIAEI